MAPMHAHVHMCMCVHACVCTCACMGAHVRTPQGKGGWGHYSKMPSVLSLLPGGMVPWTRHGPRFATGAPVVGRDSRRQHDPRGTLPWRDSTTRVRGRNWSRCTTRVAPARPAWHPTLEGLGADTGRRRRWSLAGADAGRWSALVAGRR